MRALDVLVGHAAVAIENGDCRLLLAQLPDNSVDAIVTDPPYELGFMGKAWDSTGIANDPTLWAEALRVLKPGGHLLAFSGSRTYHRMACAVEDGGFEIRDQAMWLYGSGMPKSRNVAKYDLQGADAEAWDGWGTALKPAHEPIVVARKPLAGTVGKNLVEWGVGGLHIDACRIPHHDQLPTRVGAFPMRHDERVARVGPHATKRRPKVDGEGFTLLPGARFTPEGRWPANVLHDGSPDVLALFPAAAGAHSAVKGTEPSAASVGRVTGERARIEGEFHDDTGSAARFFYCAKASRADRNDGCEGLDRKAMNWSAGEQNPGSFQSAGTDRSSENHHPTVKPTELMRHLVRLVCPPGAVVLDPFMGSGSTGRGARLEGCRFIGFELSAEYASIAARRIAAAERPAGLQGAEPVEPAQSLTLLQKTPPALAVGPVDPRQMSLI